MTGVIHSRESTKVDNRRAQEVPALVPAAPVERAARAHLNVPPYYVLHLPLRVPADHWTWMPATRKSRCVGEGRCRGGEDERQTGDEAGSRSCSRIYRDESTTETETTTQNNDGRSPGERERKREIAKGSSLTDVHALVEAVPDPEPPHLPHQLPHPGSSILRPAHEHHHAEGHAPLPGGPKRRTRQLPSPSTVDQSANAKSSIITVAWFFAPRLACTLFSCHPPRLCACSPHHVGLDKGCHPCFRVDKGITSAVSRPPVDYVHDPVREAKVVQMPHKEHGCTRGPLIWLQDVGVPARNRKGGTSTGRSWR
jgi:hypothetical protein